MRGGIHAEAGASRGGPEPLTTASEVRPRGQVGSLGKVNHLKLVLLRIYLCAFCFYVKISRIIGKSGIVFMRKLKLTFFSKLLYDTVQHVLGTYNTLLADSGGA